MIVILVYLIPQHMVSPIPAKSEASTPVAEDEELFPNRADVVMASVQSKVKEPLASTIVEYQEPEDAPSYVHGLKLFVVMLALLLSMFLVWLS